jgi:hypothetical protein
MEGEGARSWELRWPGVKHFRCAARKIEKAKNLGFVELKVSAVIKN